jgi:hypothetical protein
MTFRHAFGDGSEEGRALRLNTIPDILWVLKSSPGHHISWLLLERPVLFRALFHVRLPYFANVYDI